MILRRDEVTEVSPDQLPKLHAVTFTVVNSSSASEYSLSEVYAEATHICPFPAQLLSAECLSQTFKKILRLKIKIEGWLSEPGDAFHLLPRNNPDFVGYCASRLQLDLDRTVQFESLSDIHPESLAHLVSGKCLSIRQLLSDYVDLNMFPKKTCLRHWAEYCTDENDKRAMLWLSSKLGSKQYMELASQHTTILDILRSFPSCQPPLDVFLTHMTHLAARPYSVASSSLVSGDEVEVVLSLIQFTKGNGNSCLGVSSDWLESLTGGIEPADGLVKYHNVRMLVYPRPSNGFKLPADHKRPLVMICAGTGVAPFVGMLRHRKALQVPLGPCWLFYGIRSKEHDYLFGEELDSLEGVEVILAESRAEKPVYVQDLLRERLDWLYDLLCEKDGVLLLCGDELTMVKSVNEVLQQMIMEKEQLADFKAASSRLLEWTKSGRIIRDVWV